MQQTTTRHATATSGPDSAGSRRAIEIHQVYESAPIAPAKARAAIQKLEGILPDKTVDDLKSIVSELVMNSVMHGAGGPVELRVAVGRDAVRGEVRDGGSGNVAIAERREPGAGGLGLRIVDAFASRWGVRPHTTDVWFELPAGDGSDRSRYT